MCHPFVKGIVRDGRRLNRLVRQVAEDKKTLHASSDDDLRRLKRLCSACLDIPKSWAAIVWFPLARLRASEIVSCSTSFKAGSLFSADKPSANVSAPAFSVVSSCGIADCSLIFCRKVAVESMPPVC